jgi:hypothetical protein
MPNYNLLELRDPEKLQALKDEWEPKKEYIEKDLWVIRNFLTQEELTWLQEQANDPEGWYPTMRSYYGNNVRNKFLGYVAPYGEDGILIPPHPKNNPQFIPVPHVQDIQDRMEAVLPKYFAGAGAFQSFFEVPDEQIIAELGQDVDYAMPYHYERDESDSEEHQKTIVVGKITEALITAAFNLYVNDDFEGGELRFKNKDYVIKPEPGMLVNVPLYKEFEHMVSKVTGGNRHALYGRSWDNLENSYLSSREDC